MDDAADEASDLVAQAYAAYLASSVELDERQRLQTITASVRARASALRVCRSLVRRRCVWAATRLPWPQPGAEARVGVRRRVRPPGSVSPRCGPLTTPVRSRTCARPRWRRAHRPSRACSPR